MPERTFHWPEGHWGWPRHLSHQHGVCGGELIFIGGQVDKDMAGQRLNPFHVAAQTATAARPGDRCVAGGRG